MFLRLSTQWIHAGMAGVTVGLNYQSVEFLFKLYNVKHPKRTFNDLRIMEQAALSTMEARREKK